MKIRNKEEFLKTNKFGVGNPNIAYSRYFTGSSFLKEQNLAGKNIYLFATNGGWLGHTRKYFHKLLKDSFIKGEISIRFDGNTLKTSRDDIQNWISGIH